MMKKLMSVRIGRLRAPRLRGREGERGQALLEFAFMLPVLVLFILGLADFALLFMRYQAITDTVREGARMAVIVDEGTPVASDRAAEIVEALRGSLSRYGMDGAGAQLVGDPNAPCAGFTAQTGTPATIVIQGCGWGEARAEPARVVIRVPNDLSMVGTFAGLAVGDRVITLSSAATMRNE